MVFSGHVQLPFKTVSELDQIIPHGIFWSCSITVLLVLRVHIKVCNHLDGEERADCFA